MITDMHAHIYNEEEYREYFSKAPKSISKILVMHWHKDNLEDFLNFVKTKDNFFPVASIDIGGNISEQLKTYEELFAKKQIYGIKLYPGYQYFYPSEEKVFPVARLCQKFEKPLIFHSGDVYDPENGALLKYSHPLHIDELAVKNPECKIIISHFGFPYFLEAANVVSKNKNVFTDISGTIDKEETNSKKDDGNRIKQYASDLNRVFNYFPNIKNKVMFGTDFSGNDTPLNVVNSYVEVVKKVFTKEDRENVFSKLAEKLFFG